MNRLISFLVVLFVPICSCVQESEVDQVDNVCEQETFDGHEVAVDLESCQQLIELQESKLEGEPSRFRDCAYGNGWSSGLTKQDCYNILNCRGIGQVTMCFESYGPVTGNLYGDCVCTHAI